MTTLRVQTLHKEVALAEGSKKRNGRLVLWKVVVFGISAAELADDGDESTFWRLVPVVDDGSLACMLQ